MPTEEVVEIESSLALIKKVSKRILAICNIVSVVIVLIWLVLTCISLYQIFTSRDVVAFSTTAYLIVYTTVFLGWLLLFVRTVARFFSDTDIGDSPFGEKSIRRIRTLAYLLLFLTLFEFIFSSGSMVLFQHADIAMQFSHNTDLGGQVVKINAGALFMAAVLYSLSVVFEHGKLLQRLSDETG